jgi:hypothetical protein
MSYLGVVGAFTAGAGGIQTSLIAVKSQRLLSVVHIVHLLATFLSFYIHNWRMVQRLVYGVYHGER